MNTFLDEIEEILNDYALPFTPEGTESKAVVHQWVHAIAYGNELFAKSRGANKSKVIRILKKENVYLSASQFKAKLRKSVHLNPKPNPKFTFIDLFAGIGGMRQGFESAGGSCVFSSEFDKHAQATYHENYGEFPFGDITKIANQDKADTNWLDAIPDHDILIGGFPCQAFSIAGERQGFNDTKGRGNLFFNMAEIIANKKPKVFLFENVKNLVGHDKGNTMKVIRETVIEKLGYSFIPFILNASTHGNVAQNRERIYIVGFRGEGEFSSKKKRVKSKTEKFNIPKEIKRSKTIHDVLMSAKQDKNLYYSPDHRYFDELNKAMKSRDTLYQWRRVYVRENKSNLCPTLTANMGTGGHNVPLLRDDYGIRKLTPEECIGFQGFDKKFIFPIDLAKSHCYKQAGNSVVISVVKRIAINLVNTITYKDVKDNV